MIFTVGFLSYYYYIVQVTLYQLVLEKTVRNIHPYKFYQYLYHSLSQGVRVTHGDTNGTRYVITSPNTVSQRVVPITSYRKSPFPVRCSVRCRSLLFRVHGGGGQRGVSSRPTGRPIIPRSKGSLVRGVVVSLMDTPFDLALAELFPCVFDKAVVRHGQQMSLESL